MKNWKSISNTRKAEKFQLETWADAGAREREEDDIVDKVEVAASLRPSEKKRTALSKLN